MVEMTYFFRKESSEIAKLCKPKIRTNYLMINPDTTKTKQFSMGITEIDPNEGTPYHKHDNEEEIMFCYEGKGYIKIENQEYLLTKGCAVFVPGGVFHILYNPFNKRFCYTMTFSPPGIEKSIRKNVIEEQNKE